VAGVSLYERQLIETLLQRASPPPIEPGSGLVAFDACVDQARRAYEIAVVPAMRSAGLNLADIGLAFSDESTLAKVTRALFTAEAIVVDLSSLNPSVFYVLGLAHAIGRCPLLITSGGEVSLPFNLRSLRCIHYRNSAESLRRLREDLARALRVFLASAQS
jgi:hypothetical protein